MATEARAEPGISTLIPGRLTMSDEKSGKAQRLEVLRRVTHRPRWAVILLGTLIASAANAAPVDVVRDLAGRVGPIIGSALACTDIARPRIQTVVDKFVAVIRETAPNEAIRVDLTQVLDRSVADGRAAISAGRADCKTHRPPTGRSRTLDRGARAESRRNHRAVGGGRRHHSHGAGQHPAAGTRHDRPRNPLRHRRAVLRRQQGTRAPDEARHQLRLQPGQRCRRRRRQDAAPGGSR